MKEKTSGSGESKPTTLEFLTFVVGVAVLYLILLTGLIWTLGGSWNIYLILYAVILGLINTIGVNLTVKLVNSGDAFTGHILMAVGVVINGLLMVLIIAYYAGALLAK